jgi:hypothetical protein
MKTIRVTKRLDYKSVYLLPNKPYLATFNDELEVWTVHLPNGNTVALLPKNVANVVDAELAMA